MASRISVEIALAGGDLIEKQLADIGEAGQKAFADINKAAEQAGGFQQLDPGVVTNKFKEFGVTSVAEIEKIQTALQKSAGLEKIVQGVAAAEQAFRILGLASLTTLGGIGAAIVGLIPSTLRWADSINKVNDEARQLGLTVEQFTKMQRALEGTGISGETAAGAIKTLKGALDQVNIDRINQAFKELQDAATRGFGAQGTQQLKLLEDAAKGIGPAADLAREKLQQLGLATPEEKLSATSRALQQLGITANTVNEALPQVITRLSQLPAGAERNALAFALLGQNAGEFLRIMEAGGGSLDAFTQKLQEQAGVSQEQAARATELTAAWNRLKDAFDRLAGSGGILSPAISAGFDILAAQIDGIRSGIDSTKQDFYNIGEVITNTWNGIIGVLSQNPLEGFKAGIDSTIQDFYNIGAAVTKVGELISGLAATISGLSWDTISQIGVQAWNALTRAIQDAINRLLRFIGLMPKGTGSVSNLPSEASASSMAGGGLIGGRGSGTSDSNLAWVSRGEHIMPARVVAQPGVLAFLEALRATGGNLAAVLHGMGRFSLGGLVPRPIPAFAGGGLVGGMSQVTIQFPGLPPIGGLRATSAVVDELQRAAVLAQVRSGGRKPSRYT